jgi:hypothetical protein
MKCLFKCPFCFDIEVRESDDEIFYTAVCPDCRKKYSPPPKKTLKQLAENGYEYFCVELERQRETDRAWNLRHTIDIDKEFL